MSKKHKPAKTTKQVVAPTKEKPVERLKAYKFRAIVIEDSYSIITPGLKIHKGTIVHVTGEDEMMGLERYSAYIAYPDKDLIVFLPKAHCEEVKKFSERMRQQRQIQ